MAAKNIVTGQYVRIEQTPGSVGERMLAQLMDWVIQAAYIALNIFLIDQLKLSPGVLTIILVVVLPVLFYCPLCELFAGGQTFGKWVMKLRVVMADGSKPSLSACMLRWLMMIVDGPLLAYCGVIVMLVSRHNQRFGDLAAGTLVVKLRSYNKIQVSLDEYDYLTRNYRPSYPQAADLSLEQVDVITRTLEGDMPERISALAQKVQSVLHVTKRETIDEFFLRRIVRDYQYYALEEV
jgi:uncharacterized RDD family membrane protein YckC